MKVELILSIFALLISLWSFWLSRKTYKLSESDFLEKKLAIIPYLIDSYKIKLGKKESYICFAVTYTNQSSAPNSLPKIELKVNIYGNKNEMISLIIQATPVKNDYVPTVNVSQLELPVNLGAKETVSGWLTFLLPESVSKKVIRDYELIAKTTNNEEIIIKSSLIREITDE